MPIKYERLSRKQRITTGLASKAIRGELHQRYGFARVVTDYLTEYRTHVGPDRSVVLDDLCRSAAVHKTVANMNFTRLRGGHHPPTARGGQRGLRDMAHSRS